VNDAKTNRPRRSWIQFNGRAAVIGVAAAAVFLGLEVNWARKQTTAVAAVKAYGGFVHYDHEYVKGAYVPGREPLAPRQVATATIRFRTNAGCSKGQTAT
jgi:hypothetical protein